MTKIKRFDDLNESIQFEKEEVEGRDYYKIKYKTKDILPMVKLINLDEKDISDVPELSFYVSDKYSTKPTTIDGDDYKCEMVTGEYELGYLIFKNDEPVYIVSIYEPQGSNINSKRGLVTIWGHETIINLWLDDGEFNKMHTR